MSGQPVKKYLSISSLTFKAFGYDLALTPGRGTVWHFRATNPSKTKQYVILLAPKVNQSKMLIKIGLKKLPENHRLVVVTSGFSDEELLEANNQGYTITTIAKIDSFAKEMLGIRSRASKQLSSGTDTVDGIIEESQSLPSRNIRCQDPSQMPWTPHTRQNSSSLVRTVPSRM